MNILEYLAIALKIAQLAAQVGQDVAPFIKRIHDATAAGAPEITQADFDALAVSEKQFRDTLNDTSKDDRAAGQGAV